MDIFLIILGACGGVVLASIIALSFGGEGRSLFRMFTVKYGSYLKDRSRGTLHKVIAKNYDHGEILLRKFNEDEAEWWSAGHIDKRLQRIKEEDIELEVLARIE